MPAAGHSHARKELADTLLGSFAAENSDTCAPLSTRDPSIQDSRPKGSAIYRNIFTFPQGIDHLKYFETNPHPDKITDDLLGIWEASPKPDLNPEPAQKRAEFEAMVTWLYPLLSDMDTRLLRMTQKMQKWLDDAIDEETRIACRHLRDCLYNYFSTPTDESVIPDIQWLDYSFALKHLGAPDAVTELKKNLFNKAGKAALEKKLLEAGAFGTEKKDFYFWNTDPHNWSDISFQSRPVPSSYRDAISHAMKRRLPPQQIALGAFSVNAIPEGYTEPKGNGKYEICVNNVFFFVNDSFNFEGDQFLGYWQLNPEGEYSLVPFDTVLGNIDFRNFRRHGYGRYFPVLSRLHKAEDFQKKCWDYFYAK